MTKLNPTVLHSFCHSRAKLTKQIAKELNIPYVITFNSSAIKLKRRDISSHHCASLTASSKVIAANIAKKYPPLKDRIIQINIGAFVEDRCACFSTPRQITSIIVNQPLDNIFNFEILLNATKHLTIDGYEFILVIIGTGPAEREIHELIKRLSLTQVVTMIPEMQPLREIFSGADIYVQLKKKIGFNISLLEAMSVGMAVTASRQCNDQLLIEDKTALFFEENDELSLYSCIQKLLNKHENAKQIALAAQENLREFYSVSKMVSLLVETYKNAQKWYTQKQAKLPEKN